MDKIDKQIMTVGRKPLATVLSKMEQRLNYRSKDLRALDLSRKAAAGTLMEGDYKEWAAINNDPMVSINYVKTFIINLSTQLNAAPMRPDDDDVYAMGVAAALCQKTREAAQNVFNDGYCYYGVGRSNGRPSIEEIDARYIIHDGIERTLKDAENVIVFSVRPLSMEEQDDMDRAELPSVGQYVEYDSDTETVVVSYYHRITVNGEKMWVLDVYDTDIENPTRVVLNGLGRCPIVRFTGDSVELSDKRKHFRGLYYTFGSLQKALSLAATKVQIRAATQDDANYLLDNNSISDTRESWAGVGAREYKSQNINGTQNATPIPIQHDNAFLVQCVNLWQNVISSMLGPVVQSGSEAVTREEVLNRNQVRDAIINYYLVPISEAYAELYRVMFSLMGQGDRTVQMVGGLLDNIKRDKYKGELTVAYNLAKESGLNTQGIVQVITKRLDIEEEDRAYILDTYKQDPYASPVVLELKQKLTAEQELNKKMEFQIALLKGQLTTRIDRNAESVASTERIKRNELMYKQWATEQEQNQQALMEVLKFAMAQNNMPLVAQTMATIKEQSSPLLANAQMEALADANSEDIRNLGASSDIQAAFNDPTKGIEQTAKVTQQGANALAAEKMKQQAMSRTLSMRNAQNNYNAQNVGVNPQNVIPFPTDGGKK